MAIKVYLCSRPIAGIAEIRHQYILFKYDSEKDFLDLRKRCDAFRRTIDKTVLNHFRTRDGSLYSDLGGNMSPESVDGIMHGLYAITQDMDNYASINYEFTVVSSKRTMVPFDIIGTIGEEIDLKKVGLTGKELAFTIYEKWVNYEYIYNNYHKVNYFLSGPNCIAFAMSLLLNCGYSYDYLKEVNDRVGRGLNAGADMRIHESYFQEEQEDYTLTPSSGMTENKWISGGYGGGMVCRNAYVSADSAVSIATPALICTENAIVQATNGSTIQIKEMLCHGTLTLSAKDSSTLHVMRKLEGHPQKRFHTTVAAGNASTVNIPDIHNAEDITLHAFDRSTLTIQNSANCINAKFRVEDASTLKVNRAFVQNNARLDAHSASTLDVPGAQGVGSITGDVITGWSTVHTGGFCGIGALATEDCYSSWRC